MVHGWGGGGASYLQFAEEPLDGALAHGVDLGAVQGDPGVGPSVGTRHLLQVHQALPGLQQHPQDHEAGLHVGLKTTHRRGLRTRLQSCMVDHRVLIGPAGKLTVKRPNRPTLNSCMERKTITCLYPINMTH